MPQKNDKGLLDLPPINMVGLELDRKGKVMTVLSLVVPALVVVSLLLLLTYLRQGSESAMARLADLLPVGYAFSAGMVASVNPCGFLLLPTFLLYHLGAQEEDFYARSWPSRLSRSLLLAGIATLGFLIVFTSSGLIIAAGGQWLLSFFPYASAIIGLGMIVLGIWLLITRKTLGIQAASRLSIAPKRTMTNVFGFGIVYAVGSLGCTLPVFLAVVGSALASGGVLASLGQFVGFALGMGSVLIAVTIAVALIRGTMTGWMQRIVPFVQRISAFFLVGVGIYLVITWFTQGELGF